MDNNYKIARPYVNAIFNIAVETETLDSWSKGLEILYVVSQSEDFQFIVNNAKISNQQRLNLLLVTIKENISYMKEFLLLLIKNQRIPVLGEIYLLFDEKLKQHNNTIDGTIVSAFEISSKQHLEIEQSLSNRLKKRVNLKVEINTDLIGGIKIIINDKIIDYSIHSSLNMLATSIIG